MTATAEPAAIPSPAPIVQVAAGFMAAKQLFAANELGLFEALGNEALTATELADRAGVPERSARIAADALVGLEVLEREGARYRNGAAALAYLSGGDGPVDLRPYLTFWDAISYPHWRDYAASLRAGEPAPLDIEGPRQATFFGGVQAYNTVHAVMLAEAYDFGAHRRVLDYAGLSGSFLAEALARHPDLRGTFFAEPRMVEFATAGLDDEERERIDFVAADPLTDELPKGHDAILLEHVVHRYDEGDNRRLLSRAREAVEPGARLLVLDFYLDEGAPERPLDALLAGEYLVIDGTVVYPEAEVRAWVSDAGWRPLETRALPGSPRVLIAEAI